MAETRRNEVDVVETKARPFRPLKPDYTPTKSCIDAVCGLLSPHLAETLRPYFIDTADDLMNRAWCQERHHTLDEVIAVVAYTTDVTVVGGDPSENLYSRLNVVLSKRDMINFKPLADWYWYLLLALIKIPAKPLTVYRGLKDVSLASCSYKEGAQLCWVAFSSTSSSPSVCRDFAGGAGTMLVINATSARCVKEYSIHESEEEYLLLPNTVIRVRAAVSREGLSALSTFAHAVIDTNNAEFVFVEEIPAPVWADVLPAPTTTSSSSSSASVVDAAEEILLPAAVAVITEEEEDAPVVCAVCVPPPPDDVVAVEEGEEALKNSVKDLLRPLYDNDVSAGAVRVLGAVLSEPHMAHLNKETKRIEEQVTKDVKNALTKLKFKF